MKIDRFLRRRMVYLLVVGAVEWSISSSSVPWRSPTEMMFGDDLDSSKFSSNSYLINLVGFGSSLTFAYIEREFVVVTSGLCILFPFNAISHVNGGACVEKSRTYMLLCLLHSQAVSEIDVRKSDSASIRWPTCEHRVTM
ncbi:hypothetical protein DY000_02032472 [Brassica cretica]|uniref:Secreted protein n=1 Tax=Brassica cretica TaxID=69181 RepID=A0ABQ7DJX6_BRACR|nr:hypothetical protein DY000_02032472 [Brassica cretica]